MGFVGFKKGSDPNGIGIQFIDESINEDIDVADFYQGIYTIRSYTNSLFDITFIPEFERKNKSWYLNKPCEYENISSFQEARLLTAIDSKCSVTIDEEKSGTKQEFIVPLTSEREAELREWRLNPKEASRRTIYYVLPRDFYTFRGEIVTITTEQTITHHNLINLSEILNFSFIQFILNNVVSDERLKTLEQEVGIKIGTTVI